ncbi:MAG: hypothetical protein ACXWQO_16470, partial [Bdellovibrionota bacterium]
MMKLTLHILSMALAFGMGCGLYARAEGTKDGGGTNVVIQENELADFAKFRAEFGNKQFLINPKKFKLARESSPIYDRIKPMLDRMDSLYPGMGTVMAKAFEKPWLVVDADFAGRNKAEKKVISQTSTGVFVSLAWLRTASPEQVQKAFLHEAVRNYANELLRPYVKGQKAEERLALEDAVTEELTPVIFNELPASVVAESMKISGRIVAKKMFWVQSEIGFPTRAEIYSLLSTTGADKIIRKICSPENYSEDGLKMYRALSALLGSDLQTERTRKKLFGYVNDLDQENSRISDPSAESVVRLMYSIYAYQGQGSRAAVELCKDRRYDRFLSEHE